MRDAHFLTDKSKIKHRSPAERDAIFARCQDIVDNGFSFSHAMIDKAGSELNALLDSEHLSV